MARHENEFDDDEGFFESLIRRKDAVPMPDSMARLLKIIVGVVVLGVVAVVAWAVWPSKGGQGPDGTVPMIQADSGDFKKAPEEPGGMPIPNKDSALFETMAHKSAGQEAPKNGQVENLLEDSEQPMKKRRSVSWQGGCRASRNCDRNSNASCYDSGYSDIGGCDERGVSAQRGIEKPAPSCGNGSGCRRESQA